MPRRARLQLPGATLHLIQRGNNRSACFYADEDYLFYLNHLTEQARLHGCAIHAYCLMTNHVHLLVTPAESRAAGLMMKGLGQRYVQYINRSYRRSGTLWEGRFRSCLMQEESYVLACYRYIELNPIRASMVKHPAEYRWSSFRANAQGEPSNLIAPHPLYVALAPSDEERRKHYLGLFQMQVELDMVEQIRSATNGNYVLGSPRFQAEIAAALKRRVTKGKAGRPRRSKPDEDDLF